MNCEHDWRYSLRGQHTGRVENKCHFMRCRKCHAIGIRLPEQTEKEWVNARLELALVLSMDWALADNSFTSRPSGEVGAI